MPHLPERLREDSWRAMLALLLLLSLTLFLGCGKPEHSAPPSVVLLSIDTCRADHLGCYGYSKNTTPNLDAFAKKSTLYENAFSAVPITLPSHSTMLTGLYPITHSVRDNVDYVLSAGNATLAEILRNEGYDTGAVVGSFVMDGQFGLEQGFDFYSDSSDFRDAKQDSSTFFLERPAEEVAQVACEWLEGVDESSSFFLFVHFFDPHGLYRPPEPFATRYKDAPYDGEIAYVDQNIQNLFTKLNDLNRYDESMIVVTSDHGESLGEHDENSHSFFIYQSTVHVPFIVKRPHQKEGSRISAPVSLIDIAPTVLDELDIPNSQRFDGRPLPKSDTPDDPRVIFIESLLPTKYRCAPLFGAVDEGWKFIQSTTPELYDLSSDASERNNLHAARPAKAEKMNHGLQEYFAKESAKTGDGSTALDRDALNRLESLGYVAVRKVSQNSSSKFDAKDFVTIHEDLLAARVLIQQGKLDEVEKKCRDILAKAQVPDAYRILGRIATIEGKTREAVEHYGHYLEAVYAQSGGEREALVPRTSLAAVHNNLGLALSELGETDKAVGNLEKAVGLDPGNAVIHATLGDLYVQSGEDSKAVECYEKSLELEPGSIPTICSVAWILSTNPDEALRNGERALSLLKPISGQSHPMVLEALGAAYAETGRFAEATRYAGQALAMLEGVSNKELLRSAKYRHQLYATDNVYREPGDVPKKSLSLVYRELNDDGQ